MPMHTLIQYKDVYSRTTGNLWQYRRDELSEISLQ